jgi:hypothetical protein
VISTHICKASQRYDGHPEEKIREVAMPENDGCGYKHNMYILTSVPRNTREETYEKCSHGKYNIARRRIKRYGMDITKARIP